MLKEFFQDSWWDPIELVSIDQKSYKKFTTSLIKSYHDWILGTGVFKRKNAFEGMGQLKESISSYFDRFRVYSLLNEVKKND